MKKKEKTKAKRRKDKVSNDLFAILVCFADSLIPNTGYTQFHDVDEHPNISIEASVHFSLLIQLKCD